MKRVVNQSISIRRRLLLQLLFVAILLSGLLYLSVRTVADSAVERTQDSILGAATIAIAEELRGGEEGVAVDIPYTAFSMLGSIGQDRVFYRITIGDETVTGYDELALPTEPLNGLTPLFYDDAYRGLLVRAAAVERSVLVNGKALPVRVIVAQTRTSQQTIVASLAERAALLGIGFFVIAVGLSLLTARLVVKPVSSLVEAVGRRGPQDLRPVQRPVPRELVPLVTALNGFMSRLSVALSRTETFIAEAAHHIRTPLATLRAQAEIALRQTENEEARQTIRSMIRSVDTSARSAGQMLEHAAVVFRSDQRSDEQIDLSLLVEDITESYEPSAEMKGVRLVCLPHAHDITVDADRILLEAALRNLIDNAIKYTPKDGLIEVSVISAEGFARLEVKDSGRGLFGAQAAQLTGRFQRGANVEDVVGSGLGLTIVKEVARSLNGRFEIVEREEGGTCAALYVPLRSR